MVFKNTEDFNFNGNTVMTVNDLHCVFNLPKVINNQPKYEIRLTLLTEEVEFVKSGVSKRQFKTEEEANSFAEELRGLNQYSSVDVVQAEEQIHGLPPHAPRKAFKVDEFYCPESWMHGSGLASSYFVPVLGERGMWLDFNRNASHKHHVAVLISVQGLNPLDGQSMVDGALNLKQYKTKCPVHDVKFGADRFCVKCGYKWVPQNYLCTTGTPKDMLWLDGFLAVDGVVRQYYFTENELKGVAHQIIGAEKKVYSIGIAFYLSKNPKPEPIRSRSSPVNSYSLCGGLESLDMCGTSKGGQYTNSTKERHVLKNRSVSPQIVGFDDADDVSLKTLDIAAGAKITQHVYADPESLDFWQEKPAGMLYINYTPSDEAIKIIKRGRKDLTKGGEGFLAGLKVGN